jgi:hypothetical protein
MNAVPIVSQIKSLVLYSRGKKTESVETMNDFTTKCIGASQIKSVWYLLHNQKHFAISTQMQFIEPANLAVQATFLLVFLLFPMCELAFIHYLGFQKDGLTKKSFAAKWMASFNGSIPRNSLFSMFQQIGHNDEIPFLWWFGFTFTIATLFCAIVENLFGNQETESSAFDVCDVERQDLLRVGTPESVD